MDKYLTAIQTVFSDFKPKNKVEQNNITGAVGTTNFPSFTTSFNARLEDISKFLAEQKGADYELWKKTIFDVLNKIGVNKLSDGAWAELCAIQSFIPMVSDYGYSLRCEIDVDAKQTLGKEHEKSGTNYDLGIDDNLLIDVKILGDKTLRLIQEKADKAIKNKNLKASFLPQIDHDIDFEEITKNLQRIQQEIDYMLDSQETYMQSKILPALSYRIIWESGILSSISSHSPYAYAEQNHHLIFKHFSKLHRKKPTILVYVVFPWFSDRQVSFGFQGDDSVIFRSMARRIFMQYKNKKNPDYPHLPKNATSYLSGIIFIKDGSIKNEKNKLFMYMNPNAKNKVKGFMLDCLKYFANGSFDDFSGDNY